MCNATHPFTAEEIKRLTTYKAAVEAGFYTDDTAEERAQSSLSRSDVTYLFSSRGWRLQSQP